MYVHLGADVIVRKNEIVGIFELDGKVTPPLTAEFLKEAEKNGKAVTVGYDLPKSFIITNTKDGEKVYFSPIAVASLLKRCELPF